MKRKLLDFIICPVCKKNLSLKIFKEDNGEIEEGLLACSCGQFFPIIKNIPRILLGDLRESIYKHFPDFFLKYKNSLPEEEFKEIKPDNLKKKETLESFGFLWHKYPKDLKEWEKNFKFYFAPLDNLELLRNKTILDAGCGNGRHTFYSADFAKEVIAFDLSLSVNVAFENNKRNNNTHFLQADIYNLPFRPDCFDFIFSIGVLHYLPFPEQGFKKLLELLKDQSGILIYVYHAFPKTSFNYYLVKITDCLRFFTTKTSYRLLYFLSYPIALISYLVFVLPYIIFSKIFKIRKITQINWPLKLYSGYPFKVLINDTFDRFSPPLEHRYSKQEILDWYQKAELKNIKILGQGGWRIFGIKNKFI